MGAGTLLFSAELLVHRDTHDWKSPHWCNDVTIMAITLVACWVWIGLRGDGKGCCFSRRDGRGIALFTDSSRQPSLTIVCGYFLGPRSTPGRHVGNTCQTKAVQREEENQRRCAGGDGRHGLGEQDNTQKLNFPPNLPLHCRQKTLGRFPLLMTDDQARFVLLCGYKLRVLQQVCNQCLTLGLVQVGYS